MTKKDRVYIPYTLWEDWKAGQYDTTAYMDQSCLAKDCVLLLSEPRWFEDLAHFIVTHWPNSAIHNLSNTHRNRQAWLGQATCCYMFGAPEFVTKQAWGMLTESQQKDANESADRVIAFWEEHLWSRYEVLQKV